MKIKLIQILIILYASFNQFLSNVSGDPENVTNELLPIDLNLIKINTSYYNIFKSDNEPEGYKLILKEEYMIKSITNNNDPIWKQTGDSYCKGFTVYPKQDQTLILIINMEENNNKDYVFLLKEGISLGYLGVFNLIYQLNRETLIDQLVKREKLNVSDHFDEIYFKHTKRIFGNYSYQEYEPNQNEKFYGVRDRIENIWIAKKVDEREILANKIEVYKESILETYNENRKLKQRRISRYRLIIITLENNEKIYFKLDKIKDKWVEMKKYEFINYYKNQGLNRKIVKNEEQPKINSTKPMTEIVDISKRSNKFKYYKYNLSQFKYMTLVPKEFERIDKIIYKNQIILEVKDSKFLINLVKTNEDWHYIEYISKEDTYINPIKYYQNYYRDQEWRQVKKSDFLNMIRLDIISCQEECLKYGNIFGIEKGIKIESLPSIIREKIGDESINVEENIYEEIYEDHKKNEGNEIKKEPENVNEKEEDTNIKKEENISVDINLNNNERKDNVKEDENDLRDNKEKEIKKDKYHKESGYWSFENKKNEIQKKKEEESESENDEPEEKSEDESDIDDKIVKKIIKKLKDKVFKSGYKEEGVILWVSMTTIIWITM